MARLTTVPAKTKILVANLDGASDPSHGRRAVVLRSGFEYQLIGEVAREATETRVGDPLTPGLRVFNGALYETTEGVAVASTGTITVSSNDFTAAATLLIGPYTVTSNVDFTPGGSTSLTATALATAINNLPTFTASAVGAVVTVHGPTGPNGNNVHFEDVYSGTVQNYTLSPTNDFLSGGEPRLGPPTLL